MDGHLGVRPGQAVFWDLPQIRPGDLIVVTRADGKRLVFIVDRISTVSRTASLPELFTSDSSPELWLVTCSGKWDYARATYDDRFIVHARLLFPTWSPQISWALPF
jgi:sortase (surface protein transpeptidase)